MTNTVILSKSNKTNERHSVLLQKKFLISTAFTFVFFVISFFGFSQVLLTEQFNYTPDAVSGLSAQSAGVWTRTNSGDSILVVSGNLSYTGLAASAGNKITYGGSGSDAYTGFTSQTSGTVYCSFLLNVSSLGSLGTTGGYTIALTDASTSFASTVWIRLSGTANFNIGLNPRTTAANTVWLSNTLNANTTYLVVISLESVSGTANDISNIWVNPVSLGTTAPAADATATNTGTDLTSIQRVLVRQDNPANTPGTIEIDEIRVGLNWADVTPSGIIPTTPSLNGSSLPSFGNVCNNSIAGPNSFTISGSVLSPGNITVGPLSGYSFSTTSGGTYTSTLDISQPGGTLAPTTVFVKFNPTAIQSYNGNIPVSGGGAASINVAATGSGSAITTPTFSQPAAVCSGSSYSLPATSTNGVSGNWSPAFDNTKTKDYTFTPGASQCAVTTTLTVTVNPKTTPTFTQVAPICLGGNFTLPATSDNGISGSWAPTPDLTQTQTYTFTPATGECASVTTMTVVVNISGAEIVTADSTSITRNSVVLHGNINGEGCSAVTEYGIEYSSINAFVNGSGKQVPSSNLIGTSFSSQVNGLVQNTAYYYKAYAKSANGIVYGEPKLFFTKPISAGLTIYGSPILRGTPLHYSLSGIKQGHYATRIFNHNGQLVYNKEIINQLNFIDDSFILPAILPSGVYDLQIFCPDFKINKKFLVL